MSNGNSVCDFAVDPSRHRKKGNEVGACAASATEKLLYDKCRVTNDDCFLIVTADQSQRADQPAIFCDVVRR